MKRTIMAVIAAATSIVGGLVVTSGVVSAHHPEIEVNTDCGDDGWTATYTVRADADRNLMWSVNDAPEQADEIPFVFVESFGFDVDSDSFSATAKWSNGAGPETRSADADRPDGCDSPPPPDPCSWPTVRDNDANCLTPTVVVQCGRIDGGVAGGVTNRPTWVYGVWFSTSVPTGPADGTPGTLTFPDDSGDHSVYWWIAGTENDAIHGVFTFSSPGQEVVETNCQEDTTTTTEAPTTTTEAPTTTVPPLVPGAEVICTSTGPDYVSWQLTNTGEVDIVSPVPLAPGESAVLEEMSTVEGSLTVEVGFADESTGTFTYGGEGCSFVPPVVTTQPPTTTVAPTTTVPSTDPPVVTDPPVTDPVTPTPATPTPAPVVLTGALPQTL